jgi:hypothetical protein
MEGFELALVWELLQERKLELEIPVERQSV